MLKRTAILLYGSVSYALFFACFLYAVGFVGNILVPVSMDSAPLLPLGAALAVNIGLLGLFAVQHSVMARPAFKKWWTRFVPEPIERSTYVLFSTLALVALFALWQPLGGVIWQVENQSAQMALYAAYGFGWLLVLVSTFLINHFDLFGLRQVWFAFRGKPYTPVQFREPLLYKYVRHPLYVGWFFAFWATPTMTVTHLLFAIATTAYILIAIQLEERDLIAEHGDSYRDYRKRVPMLIPSFARRANRRIPAPAAS